MTRIKFPLPGVLTWVCLVIAALIYIALLDAQSNVNELTRHGVESTASITKKFSRRESSGGKNSASRTVYYIEYAYTLPDGRKIESRKSLDFEAWEKHAVGQVIPVRYSLKNPDLHETGELEYVEGVSTMQVLIVLGLLLALLAYVFDVRRTYGGLAKRVSITTSVFFYLCVASAGGAMLVRASETLFAGDVATTTGKIIKKTKQDADVSRSGKVTPIISRYFLEYSYTSARGEKHRFTKAVAKEYFEGIAEGDEIPVRYAQNNSSMHDLRSAKMLVIADGWMIIGVLFGLIGLGFGAWDWRRWRNRASNPGAIAPSVPTL